MQQLFETQTDRVARSAAGMIAAYGADAITICQQQIEKMRRRNDVAGEDLWRNVLERLRAAGTIAPRL